MKATPVLALLSAVLFATVPAQPALPELGIEELQARMAAGRLTARELLEACLQRIEAVDRAGPRLNAVLEVNPDARQSADRLDAERRAGRVRGPLHGIPVILKDNIATADRMETTAGSLALVGARPPRDAPIVARLREAGAVLLGKANLSEWANYRSTESISGWSGRGGLTLNPYALDRTASGSSTGSAVAVAAGLCVVAVGTETNGSIVSPSSQCGLVGIKPTVGALSRTGIIPISATNDTAGPMTRSVRDAALVLAAMAGADPDDEATRGCPPDFAAQVMAAVDRPSLRGVRLGVFRGQFSMRPGIEPLFESLLATLREAGATLVELGEVPSPPELSPAVSTMYLHEFKAGLNAYFATLGPGSRIKSLADLIAFNRAHAAQEMPLFGQQLLERAQEKGPLTDAAYLEARATCLRLARAEILDARLDEHRLDAFVAITNGPAGLVDPIFGGSTRNFGSGGPAAVAGYPHITVPAGHMADLPFGLSFFGRAWSEPKLLAYAAEFEARTRAWRPPQFHRTAPRP